MFHALSRRVLTAVTLVMLLALSAGVLPLAASHSFSASSDGGPSMDPDG